MSDFVTPDVRDGIPASRPPIFPMATIESLEEDLAASDRTLEQLAAGPVVDLEQLNAARARVHWWRDRIVAQLDDMKAAAQ